MAYCTNCGHQLADGAKFCYECGAKVNELSSPRAEQRKTVYDGEIHKCPNCGEILDAYTAICKTCGYEFRGISAVNSVKELSRILQEIEAQRPSKKWTSIYKQAFSDGDISKTDKQIVNVIKNFAIPNSKEDIMEFAILASSNIDVASYGAVGNPTYDKSREVVSNAWLSKLEQAYQKMQLFFSGTKECMYVERMYVDKKKTINKKKKGILFLFLGLLLLALGIPILVIALTGGFS